MNTTGATQGSVLLIIITFSPYRSFDEKIGAFRSGKVKIFSIKFVGTTIGGTPITWLYALYNEILRDYNTLKENLTQLSERYKELNALYNKLRSNYQELRNKHENLKIVIWILIALLIVLGTVFAVRYKNLREMGKTRPDEHVPVRPSFPLSSLLTGDNFSNNIILDDGLRRYYKL